ncbi:MAG TPA: hypothetical protein VN700_08375 [Vicinamibacterales bacterium]|nr:hypothetical protein [Vicinamibacterales bacterium]
MRRFLPPLGCLIVAGAVAGTGAAGRHLPAEILNATGGLPAHIVGQFSDAIGFAETSTGESIVLDRRAHTLYAVNRQKTSVRKVLVVGFEEGKVLRPGVLALSSDDILAVADAPNALERIQYFSTSGTLIGGFYLQTRSAPRLSLGPLILNGVGSMSFTGKTFLVNRPETGALFSEIDNSGTVIRQIGTLRPTGHERDADVHLAMNMGLPLADPGGGYYFVFMTGVPKFQKYDANGALVFERHVEGIELDRHVQSLPTTWPRRDTAEGRGLPIVPPLVRAAAVDPSGRLWVSLVEPYTYVYDKEGQKVRTVQFKGATAIAANSLFFTKDGRVLVTPGCYQFSTTSGNK